MKISFKGVEFYLKSTITEIENNVNIYEVPNGSLITENTGPKTQVIPVIGFAVGKHREMIRDQLLNACRETTPGLLNHPELGLLTVYARKITVSTRYNEQNVINFSLEFVEATSEKSLLPTVDKLVEFMKEAKNIREEFTGYFLLRVALLSLPEQTLKEVLRGILRVQAAVTNSIEINLPGDIYDTLADFGKRFLELFDKRNKETSTEDDLYLIKKIKLKEANSNGEKELKKIIFMVVSAVIIEKTAKKISKGLILNRNLKERFIKLCYELREESRNNFFQLSCFIDLAKSFPFKNEKNILGVGNNALELIYMGNGNLEELNNFLVKNEIDSPFSISKIVGVEND